MKRPTSRLWTSSSVCTPLPMPILLMTETLEIAAFALAVCTEPYACLWQSYCAGDLPDVG